MKKNIISIILLLFSASAMAQQSYTEMTSQEVIVDNSYRWYAQAHINGTLNSSEDLRYMKLHKSLGWGADIAVGYNFNDFWGGYVEFAYNKNKASGKEIKSLPGIVLNSYSYNSFEPSINVTYNLSNGFLGYKPGRKNNFYVHGGPVLAIRPEIKNTELLIEKPTSGCFFGGKIGVNYIYNYNNWVALTADVSANFFDDRLSGNAWEVVLDSRFHAAVGLRVFLSKSKKPAREVVYRDEIVVKHDTVKVREEIDIRDVDVYPIYFDTNKSDIASAKTADLKTVADILTKNPEKIVYVLGYANKITESDNAAKLSAERAEVITDELINKYDIDETRVITHKIGTQDQPFTHQLDKNQATICIITDLKHF